MRARVRHASAPRRIQQLQSRGRRPCRVRATAERESTSQPDAEGEDDVSDPSAIECETVCSAEGDFQVQQSPESQKLDLYKAGGVAAALTIVAASLNTDWVASHEQIALVGIFLLGYAGIIVEEELAFNKAGVALVMAVSLWTVRSLAGDHTLVTEELSDSLAEVSEIIFFLLGAMTIVEVVDAHQGFKIITDAVSTRSKTTLMWIVGTITFFMSAILDNLTSTIVMVSLLRKLCPDPETRKFLGAVVVITANAGGAWTPIGDVTTTMLWISGQVTTLPTMRDLFLPSLCAAFVPMLLISQFADEVKGDFREEDMDLDPTPMAPRGQACLCRGHLSAAVRARLQVGDRAAAVSGHAGRSGRNVAADRRHPSERGPALATGANCGILLTVCAHGVCSQRAYLRFSHPVHLQLSEPLPTACLQRTGAQRCLHTHNNRSGQPARAADSPRVTQVPRALSRIDTQGIIFFLGVLMSIACLDASNLLKQLAELLDSNIPSKELIATVIGLASAVIDNVPLVAATMGMYDLATVPQDSMLWQLIAYCAGTGGSILIIGSAAGVAFMGMENAEFLWYVKRVSPWGVDRVSGRHRGVSGRVANHRAPARRCRACGYRGVDAAADLGGRRRHDRIIGGIDARRCDGSGARVCAGA